MLKHIISGGQTGVDRAGLDAALQFGIPIGGFCPHGRWAEDGTVPDRYPLVETESGDYRVRTKLNVENADGTLILNTGKLSSGTAMTADLALKLGKPYLIVQMDKEVLFGMQKILAWLNEHQIKTLNVAGPRESKCPGIQKSAEFLLTQVLHEVCRQNAVRQLENSETGAERAPSELLDLQTPETARPR